MEEKRYLDKKWITISWVLFAVIFIAVFVSSFRYVKGPVPAIIAILCFAFQTAIRYWALCCPYCGHPDAGWYANSDGKWSWECCPKCRHELEFAPPAEKDGEDID